MENRDSGRHSIMSKYQQMYDGEGVAIPLKRRGAVIKFACCDCQLVHKMSFVVDKAGKVMGFAVARDNRATAAKRRKKRGKTSLAV